MDRLDVKVGDVIKKGEQIPHVGDLLFSSEAEEYCTEKILSKDITSRTFSFYYPIISKNYYLKYLILL